MAFQPVPGTAIFVANYTYQGTTWVNTFYAFKSGVWSDVDLQAATDAVDASLAANLKPLLSTGIAYNGVNSRGLREEFDLFASSVAGAGPGAVAQQLASAQASYCVTRYSALTGRSTRGRVYLPSPCITQMDSNNKNFVSSSYRNAVVAALDDLIADLGVIDWQSVIVSRRQGGVVLATALTYEQVGWRTRDLRIDTQRRRLVGSG